MVFLGLVFLLKGPAEYTGFGLFVITLYFLSGVAGSFLKILKPGIILILFTLVLNMVFTPGRPILSMGPLVVTEEGLIHGLAMGFRLVYLIALSSLITLTTSPVRMTDGLELLMKPFKRIGLPAGELAMMMNIALRFIPTFWEETDKIIKAQVSRGADFNSRNIARRLRYLAALLVPLFVSAFRKADELSLAMEARGYAVGMERTSLYKLEYTFRDYLVFIGAVVVSVSFVAYKYIF